MKRVVVLEAESQAMGDAAVGNVFQRLGWEVVGSTTPCALVCADGVMRARGWLESEELGSKQLLVLVAPDELRNALELLVQCPFVTVLPKPVSDDDLDRAGMTALDVAENLMGNGQLLTALKGRKPFASAVVSALRENKDAVSPTIPSEMPPPADDATIHTGKLVSLGTLAGGVAHEINNPLSTILAFTQILLSEERSKSDKEALNFIESSALRCKRVLDGMLRFSRHHSLKLEYGTLNHVVKECLVLFEVMLKTHPRVHLDVSLAPTMPAANLDANLIEQVLINLLQNAVHAMTQDQGTIWLRTGASDGNTWVQVEDTGQGIKPEHLSKLFHRGFTTKPVGVGTGFGLSIAREIVERHHGRIEVKSELGKGTTFTVLIPALTASKKEVA